jgi:hypothetical protein
MKNLILVFAITTLSTMSACGGSAPIGTGGSGSAGKGGAGAGAGAGSGGSCPNAPSCGGDVVGNWTVSSTCIDSGTINEGTAECPGLSGRSEGFTISGTVSYKADLTYVANTTGTGHVVIDYPASCLTAQGITCAELSDGVMANNDPTFSSVSCVSVTLGCACTFVLAPTPSMETGTYSTSGGVLTEQASDATSPDLSAYCVNGNTLTLSPSMMGGGDVTGTITLTKQ